MIDYYCCDNIVTLNLQVLTMAEQSRNPNNSKEAESKADSIWIEKGTGYSLLQSSLLADINAAQRELGSTSRYKFLPNISEDIAAGLQGKRVLIVDDSIDVLQHWSPLLLAATLGTSKHVLHSDQSLIELCREITLKDPEIVLLDYSLSGELTGPTLAARLKLLLPGILVMGFSSDDESNLSFLKSGVLYTANKSRENEALERIATAVSFHRNETQKGSASKNSFSQFFQELEEKFEQSYGHSFVLKQCRLISQLPDNNLSSRPEDYVGALCNIADYGFSSLRNYLAVLEHERQRYCTKRAGNQSNTYLYTGHDHRALTPFLNVLVPLLPERLRRAVEHLELVNAQPGHDSFALLFHEGDQDGGRANRYLITQDKQLKMNNCYHYDYLSMSPSGQALLRAKTDVGGGRAFFDGFRLMAHPEFTSCALDPIFRKGNYQFDSTKHVIVNGFLFEVSEGFEGHSGWDEAQFFSQGLLQRKGVTIQATGKFLPSELRLNEETGFSDVAWSAFQQL